MKPELLAPAGDLERLKIALLYGADAVYIGGTLFSLRANAINFTKEDLYEGVKFAHSLNKKVYVTVNIILHNKELNKIIDYLKELEQLKVDAIIVSDPAIIKIAKSNTNLEIHLSTQQSTLNKEALEFYKNQGVTRVVLARESTKEDIIEDLTTGIEIETFIHGAMCAGYSGRCVLSNYLTNRDANRGGCSQICRWSFDLVDDKLIKKDKDFTFCTKDLSMLKHIPELIKLGVTSFKIEGRMRSIYYIATIVRIYRKVIDEYCNNPDTFEYNSNYEKELFRCANRDSIDQFYDTTDNFNYNYYNDRLEASNQDFLGIVLDYKDGIVTLEQRNYFKTNDLVEIFGPNYTYSIKIPVIKDIDGNTIDIVNHPRQIVTFKCDQKLNKFDMLRKKLTN